MFRKLIVLSLLLIGVTSCEFIMDSKDEVMALKNREITYDDFTYETDNFNQTVYLDLNRKRMSGHYMVMYNEKISEEFEVKSGLLNGFHKNYYPEGVISKVKNYKDGVLNGESIFYTKEGVIFKKGSYKNGKLNGDLTSYNEEGKIVSIRRIVDDIEYYHFYRDEKMILSEFKKNINGTVFDLIVRYDAFENIILAVGKRDYEKDFITLYAFDSQFKLIETINTEEEPTKLAYYMNIINIPK